MSTELNANAFKQAGLSLVLAIFSLNSHAESDSGSDAKFDENKFRFEFQKGRVFYNNDLSDASAILKKMKTIPLALA